jgi:hypothetical protein
MDSWFHGVGFPQYIYSDSGPRFNAAKFKDYCAKHFITPLVEMTECDQTESDKSRHYAILESDKTLFGMR